MDESDAFQYWCHMCSQTVNPIIGIETIKCPICQSGFVEEMASAEASENFTEPSDSDPDPALSLWAPILLGMMDNSRRLRRIRRMEFNTQENEGSNNGLHHYGETELDRELESIIRQRRRSSATILHLLEGIRAGIQSSEPGNNPNNTDNNNNRDRERVIFIDPSNQTFMVHGSSNSEQIGSLGDYFTGPGLELLLQHLSENDPNRYGTPPARKEAVEGLANVKIEETIQCSVCLDECEIGVEVKEMPCKHKFHGECILPWLELHSSCPVCRYQLPFDESKVGGDLEGPRNSGNNGGGDNGGNENGRRFSAALVWPFSSLFSSSSSGDSSPSTSRGDED